MGNKQARARRDDAEERPGGRKISSLGDATRVFLPSELTMLHAMFKDLEQKDHTMDKGTFLSFFKLPGMLGERLFAVFDNNHDGAIDYEEFIEGLATYVRGTKEQRIELLFHMYDLNDTGQVSPRELSMMLHSLVDPSILANLPDYVTHASRLVEAAKNMTPKLPKTPEQKPGVDNEPVPFDLNSDSNSVRLNTDSAEGGSAGSGHSTDLPSPEGDVDPDGDIQLVQGRTGIKPVIPEEDVDASEQHDKVGGLPNFSTRRLSNAHGGDNSEEGEEQKTYDHNPILHDPFEGPINVVREVNVAAAIGAEEEKWVVDRIVEYAFKTCDPEGHGFLSLERFMHWIDMNPCVMNALESVFSKQQCWMDPRSREERLTIALNSSDAPGVSPSSGAPIGAVTTTSPAGSATSADPSFSRSSSGNVSATSAAVSTTTQSAYDAGMRGLLQHLRPLQQVLLCEHCGFACRHCHLCGSPLEMVHSMNYARCTNTTTGTCGRWTTEGLLTFCLQCGHRMQPDPAVIAQRVAAAAATAAAAANGAPLDDQGFTTLRRETAGIYQLPTLPMPGTYRSRTADREDDQNVAYEGYLFKKSGIVRQWRARYVVLRDGFMYIFKEREDKTPRSVTFLEECFIEIPEEVEHESDKYFGFEVITKTHKYTFYARSFHERKAWVSHLRCAAKTQHVEDFYELKRQIGKGKFATVYEAVRRATGRLYAVKVVSKSLIEGNQHEQEALRAEIAIMKLVSHPNIIHMKEVFKDHHNIYIVMPLIAHGDLFDRILLRRVFPEDTARVIAWKLLSALDYLHERGIIHRDLKPENILMEDKDDDTKIVLADFGLSIFSTPDQVLQMNCGTISYVAPEVLTHKGYSKMVDMWSLGVIIYVLLCGELPFQGRTQAHVIRQTLHGALVFTAPEWKTVSTEARDFVSQLLEKDPELRPSTSRAMMHPWFENLRKKEAMRLNTLRKSMSLENLAKASQAHLLLPAEVASHPVHPLPHASDVKQGPSHSTSRPTTPLVGNNQSSTRPPSLQRVSTPTTPLTAISDYGNSNSMGCAGVASSSFTSNQGATTTTTATTATNGSEVVTASPSEQQQVGSLTNSSPSVSLQGDSFAHAEASSLAQAVAVKPDETL